MTSKFNIGDSVRVNHHTSGTWDGIVYKKALTDDIWEYWITNGPIICESFPLLAWEHEVTLLERV